MLDSLKFDEVRSRHDGIKPALQNTCQWFLTEQVYLDWFDMTKYEHHHGFLWISGKPGAGKSTMMKFLYSHVRNARKQGSDAAVVAFFFNARGEELEKSTVGLYRSLLFQILSSFRDLPLPVDLTGIQNDETARKASWTLPELQNMFHHIVENLGQRRLICFIDALDECDENQVWTMIDLLQDLGNIASRTTRRLHVCFSSRHYPRVEVQPCLRQTLEHQKGHARDIEKYVCSKLVQKEGKAAREVITLILEKAAGVFIWVVLVVQMLRREFQRGNLFAIKNRVQGLPSDLSNLFRDMVSRDNENMEDLLLGIQWILFATRPLTGREFFFEVHAGQHRQQPESLQGWDSELLSDRDMEHFVSTASKGLAEITASKKPTVQFIHESVRDFLLKDKGIQQLWPQYTQVSQFEAISHDCLKACCAFFLQVDITATIPPSERKVVDARRAGSRRLLAGRTADLVRTKFPFLHYAVSNLFHHANSSGPVVPQAEFLEKVDFASWIPLHNIFEGELDNVYGPDVSKAYVFSANNWVELLRLALQSGQDIVSPKEEFSHPLIVASANGHEVVVRQLLATKDMEAQPQDSSGRTPLRCAVSNNHDGVFDLLLEYQGSETALADHRGRTPFMVAQQLHRYSMVKKLIDAVCRRATVTSEHGAAMLVELSNLGFNIEDILRAGDAVASVKNGQGKTPLQLAIDQNNALLIQYLVQLPDTAAGRRQATSYARKYARSGGKSIMIARAPSDRPDAGPTRAIQRMASKDSAADDPDMFPVGDLLQPSGIVPSRSTTHSDFLFDRDSPSDLDSEAEHHKSFARLSGSRQDSSSVAAVEPVRDYYEGDAWARWRDLVL